MCPRDSEVPPTEPALPPWRARLSLVGAVVLGLVLLVAAWGKALDPLAFAEEIRGQGLELLLPASALAVLFVGLEVGLGLALLLGARRWWTLAPASGLVALFLYLNGRAYWRFTQGLIDADESCGCFGTLLDRTPAEAFWQDLLLLVPPLLLALLGRRDGWKVDWRLPVAAAAGVASMLFAWKAPGLPLDDYATRLKPGVKVAELCAGRDEGDSVIVCLDALVPELAEGRHVVVISELDDEALLAGLDELNALATGGTGVWLVNWAGEGERMAFYWQRGPSFDLREVPEALLRPLYRELPRSFLVEDGAVEKTWAGLPPA